jgi:hypothetical protein
MPWLVRGNFLNYSLWTNELEEHVGHIRETLIISQHFDMTLLFFGNALQVRMYSSLLSCRGNFDLWFFAFDRL